MQRHLSIFGVLFLFSTLAGADTLGFVEQRFTDLHFQKGKWQRSGQPPCFTYVAREDGATVDVLRYGMNNLVPFKAAKGLTVNVCGSTAVFDEGFETGMPGSSITGQK